MNEVMVRLRRFAASLLLLVAIAASACAYEQQPAPIVQSQQPEQQGEFVPIDQLPPQDQLPAAPLLITAYSFVALALFAYLVSVARRLSTVQREIERLESDLKRTGRS
jgi:CcmD family protein